MQTIFNEVFYLFNTIFKVLFYYVTFTKFIIYNHEASSNDNILKLKNIAMTIMKYREIDIKELTYSSFISHENNSLYEKHFQSYL